MLQLVQKNGSIVQNMTAILSGLTTIANILINAQGKDSKKIELSQSIGNEVKSLVSLGAA